MASFVEPEMSLDPRSLPASPAATNLVDERVSLGLDLGLDLGIPGGSAAGRCPAGRLLGSLRDQRLL